MNLNFKFLGTSAITLALAFAAAAHAKDGVGHGGGGDSYLRVDCRSSDKKVRLSGDVGISCSHEIVISGDISETMTQTCSSNDVQFIYTEAARTAGKIVISGSNPRSAFHLMSSGAISFKTDGSDINQEFFDFTAELTYSTWTNGQRVALVRTMKCSGESFSQP